MRFPFLIYTIPWFLTGWSCLAAHSTRSPLQAGSFKKHEPDVRAKHRYLARLQAQLRRSFEKSVAADWVVQTWKKKSVDSSLCMGSIHYRRGVQTMLLDRAEFVFQKNPNSLWVQKDFDNTLGYPGEGPSRRVQEEINNAELKLLTDLAHGRKTFRQVNEDAHDFSYHGTELKGCASRTHRGA